MAGFAGASRAGLEIVQQSVAVDRAIRQVHFDLRFNQAPDFYTVDEFGRPRDSFQYEINPDYTTGSPDLHLALGEFRDVVRGDEIRLTGSSPSLRVRDGTPADNPEPHSGGWGPVVADLPFQLDGPDLRFTATFDDLRDTDGVFSYNLFTTEFGATVSQVSTSTSLNPAAVPLPPAGWAGLMTLGGTGLVYALRRRRGAALA